MNASLVGAIAVAALVAGLFFLRFWRATHDRFFLMFAVSFWIEGAHRLFIYHWETDEAAPLHYLVRLVAYGLIIAAIVDKNRHNR
jgi:hypothetical protein